MKHPNAAIGGLGGGAGLGSLVVFLLTDVAHLNLTPSASAAIAGGIAAVVLFIGNRGIVGALKSLLYGSK